MTQAVHRSILLTPPGAGAIGVIRIVGPNPIALVNQAFRPKSGKPLSSEGMDRLRYGHFVEGDEVIDDVVVSATVIARHAEELQSTIDNRQSTIQSPPQACNVAVDISCHGGVRIIERILQTLERLGAPAVEPFAALDDVWPSRNRIENEAIGEMCLAKTQRALEFLSWQRQHLAAALEQLAQSALNDANVVQRGLEAMIARYTIARRLLHGAVVALVGPPNSGKSTLFNRLLGRPAAIVSPTAGTTRDWIAEPIEMKGVPITLVDTAGRRETHDPLEALAVEAGNRAARDADVHVLVLDSSAGGIDAHAAWPHEDQVRPVITVLNKCDLASAAGHSIPAGLPVSAKTGEGIEALVQRLVDILGFSDWREAEPCLFTERQAHVAKEACAEFHSDPVAAQRLIRAELIGPYWPDRRPEGAIIP